MTTPPIKIEITTEMVEAVVKALHDADCGAGTGCLHEPIRGRYERFARTAAEAVAPLIAAQVLRDAADLVDRGPTFPLPPSVISALLRERAEDHEAGGVSGGTQK